MQTWYFCLIWLLHALQDSNHSEQHQILLEVKPRQPRAGEICRFVSVGSFNVSPSWRHRLRKLVDIQSGVSEQKKKGATVMHCLPKSAEPCSRLGSLLLLALLCIAWEEKELVVSH